MSDRNSSAQLDPPSTRSIGLLKQRGVEIKGEQQLAKLDEIEGEIKNDKSPKKSGAVIADIISSGFKYYADHMTDKEKE